MASQNNEGGNILEARNKQHHDVPSVPRWTVVLWMAVLTSVVVLWVVPTAYAKYIAVAQGNAAARIAAFDISDVKHAGFGDGELLYFHKGNTPQNTLYIEAKNNSDVTVRAKLRFFNVLRDNGNVATSGYNWWSSPNHRRMLLDNVNIFNGTAPAVARANSLSGTTTVNNNTAYPRIRNVRTANTSGTAYGSAAPQYYYFNTSAPGNEGAIVAPGETIRFYFDISHELYRQGMSPDTNIHNVDDYAGDGTFDAVFRLNFDIIATQVD